MASYWLENITDKTTCRDDYHPLTKASYSSDGLTVPDAYMCTHCNSIYLSYINAEVAAQHQSIRTSYLSSKERRQIQNLLNKEKQAQAQREEAEKRAERERLRKIKEEKARIQRLKEEEERKALAALKAKQKELILKINHAFETDYFSAELFFEEHNKENLLSSSEFLQLQDSYLEKWFSEHTPKGGFPPDKDQCKAIGSTRKNIEVVARAGSGKTSTIVNRYRFLTEHCNANPSSVLMLAFNKKAAGELREKMEELFATFDIREAKMPHVMTFHALAYSIVHPEETLIYDDEEAGARTLSKAVQQIIDNKIRDDIWAPKIREVMLLHFKGNWEAIETGGHNLSEEQQLIYRRSLPNQTLNNEYVKSYGEKVIANILFEHDIEYTYEKYFKWKDGTPYRPDFTVYTSDGNPVIIEYLGLAGDPEYDQLTARKEEYWNNRRVQLIKVFKEDVAGDTDTLSKELLEFLKDEGVSYRKLSEEEIWERIKERAIDEFTKAITSFIGRCRKKDLSVEVLCKLIQNYSSELPTEELFLEVACNIYEDYLRKLQSENLEDFDGLISRAVQDILQGKTGFDSWRNRGDLRDLSYIMIDEYQDFSYLFDHFLDAIRTLCPQANVFCVGDDWQAINAFAGSDVQYFHSFTNRYVESARYDLQTNYRSKKKIVDIATRLMARNESDSRIQAAKLGAGTVRLGYLSNYEPAPVEIAIHGYTDRLTPAILRLVSSILDQGKNVVFLTRTNDRLPLDFTCRTKATGTNLERFLASVRKFFPPEKRYSADNKERITASTTHKYKGKENDAVIIMDAMMGFYPLIHPTWIFQRIFGDTIDKLIEDEKRLFYVALSRAKEDLYILTMKDEESPFLSTLGRLNTLLWDDYSPVKTDAVSIKIEVRNQPGKFITPPTMVIKELLKADDFKWDRDRTAWCRYYSRDDYDIEEIMGQAWTHIADHVFLIQYDEDERIEDAYLFADGTVTQFEVEGKLFE